MKFGCAPPSAEKRTTPQSTPSSGATLNETFECRSDISSYNITDNESQLNDDPLELSQTGSASNNEKCSSGVL